MPEGIRKRNGRYQAYASINGKQFAQSFDRQADAVRWRTELLSQAQRGTFIEPDRGRIRLDRWMRTWLDVKRGTISEGSWTRYESISRNHVEPHLGHWHLDQLDVPMLQRWVNQMEPSAAHSNLPILRIALQYAVTDGRIQRNPARMVELPTYKSDPMTFLEPDELRQVADDPELDQWEHDAILGLAFTGARVSEFAAITPDKVNPLKGTIDIYATKTKSWRTISIAPPIRDVVERRLALGHEQVWTTGTGAQIRPPNFRSRTWYPLRERHGFTDVRVHDLRHTCASWLIRAGHNPVQVCGWMGHSKPTQTLDTYAHLFAADMGDMAASLAAMWDAEPDGAEVRRIGEVGT